MFNVARCYVRLKTEEDFEKEVTAGKLQKTSSGYQRTVEVHNPYYGKTHLGGITRDNGEPETIKWTYTKIVNPDNGIEMYVDDYGNVQYVPLENPPTNFGTYSTFGRTNFTTHGYTVDTVSANNLFVSTKSHIANH